jgi:hypothetical protein
MRLGDVVRLKRPCMNAAAGTIGYVYEQYTIGSDHPGISVIFANGDYDGFSLEEQETLLEYLYSSNFIYLFCNVIQVRRDYHEGVFNEHFIRGASLHEKNKD